MSRNSWCIGSAVIALAGSVPVSAVSAQQVDRNEQENSAQAGQTEGNEILVIGETSQVTLTGEYPGGQVARGGRAGILGNIDFLESPFNGTAYTQELIQNQQSETIADVLQNDPVVRVAQGFGNFQEVYIIRGFPVFSDDITYNGLYGILPRQLVAAELLERVEVFRGANAFINGAAPGTSGSGGTINLVGKRAPSRGISELTAGFENNGQVYVAADLGRRFGPDNDWGFRINAAHRNGETSIDEFDQELTVLSVGLDYAGERFRFSADLGYQDNFLENPRPQVTPLGDAPEVPEADANYAQPGTFSSEEQLFGVFRAELDASEALSMWAAAGGRWGDEENVLLNPTAAADGSTTAFRFDNTRDDRILSADAGIRAEFETGAIGHRAVLSASIIDLDFENAFALSDFFNPVVSDLFNPTPAATLPTADFFTGGVLSDPLTTERVINKSIALANTFSLADERVLITAGVRYQDIFTRAFDFNTGAETSRFDEDAFTPVGGIVFRATPDLSLYGNYAEGLQPGAVAPPTSGGVAITNAGEVLDPFRGEQFEVGTKYDGGDFGGTIGLFSVTRQNAIVVNQIFQPSGEQRNRGIELSFFGEPMVGLRVLGGATIIDAELNSTQDGVNEGNTVIGVPEFQGNLNVEWDVPFLPGFVIDGRITYTGDQFINEANTAEIDSWARLDLGVRYETEFGLVPVTIRARFDNVTNNAYWASSGGFPGANYLVQGAPRTFIATISADF
ncbi:MAG: TonB-dependent siderophore receptor [Pseudomonadota bacterium]